MCRIIFYEMVEARARYPGYGVSSYLQDNEHQLIHVKIKDGTETIGENTWTFQEYVNDKQIGATR